MSDRLTEDVTKFQGRFAALKAEVGKVLVGQDDMLHRLVLGLLAGGHVLLEGVPGLAKTLVIRTLADAVAGTFSRIQFTPDMLPGDVVGTQIFNPREGSYTVRKGPVFGNLILADEINRAPAKVQSALLEAMQEKQVTLGDQTFRLADPFLVLATQNPIEQEGTYPLPEAQLDRFLMQIDVDYPDHEAERKIVFDTTGTEESKPKPTVNSEELLAAQRLVRRLPVGESVVESILKLVRSARPGPDSGDIGKLISWGPSPRASQALMLVARARALIDGRLSPSIDDVLEMAEPILKHRMALTFAARADGESVEAVIGKLKARIG
jgi:MoxR-like ATPase